MKIRSELAPKFASTDENVPTVPLIKPKDNQVSSTGSHFEVLEASARHASQAVESIRFLHIFKRGTVISRKIDSFKFRNMGPKYKVAMK